MRMSKSRDPCLITLFDTVMYRAHSTPTAHNTTRSTTATRPKPTCTYHEKSWRNRSCIILFLDLQKLEKWVRCICC